MEARNWRAVAFLKALFNVILGFIPLRLNAKHKIELKVAVSAITKVPKLFFAS